ncbi:MAG: BMC domain-containing protein [Lachnospiraceae bacterium]|nr:BMC domain-containing protein [Lachnospiraceae bacterium]
MGNAYGLVEIVGVVAAMDALDKMCKAANVSLATWERRLGGRLVTLVVEGDVSDCEAAVKAAMHEPIKNVVSHGVIANPHDEIVKLVDISASRFKNEDWTNFHNKTYL